jgi:guanylate cyclase soluble subunit alpha
VSLENFQKRLGYLYFTTLFGLYENELKSIGSTMQKFFNILNSFHEALINHNQFGQRFLYLNESFTGYTPSFKCEVEKVSTSDSSRIDYRMVIISIQESATFFLRNFYHGVIEATGKKLWDLDVIVDILLSLDMLSKEKIDDGLEGINNEADLDKYVMGYSVRISEENKESMDRFISGTDLSDDPNDTFISADIFKSVFPFSILFDHTMTIRQVGDGLIRHLGHSMKQSNSLNFLSYFSIISPKLNEYTFDSILINESMSYVLKIKCIDNTKNNQYKDMELKGSMMFVEESDSLLFIGSPAIQHLEELTGRGLYISDIPIHDATRDIILVGEQTKAQEGLKSRMEKLKQSIVKTGEDIEEEKQKNIELLNMIFPSDIAKKLWGGNSINFFNFLLILHNLCLKKAKE